MRRKYTDQYFILILFFPLQDSLRSFCLVKGFPKLYLLEVVIVAAALILSIAICYYKLTFYNTKDIVAAFTWIITYPMAPSAGLINIDLGIKIDNVTVLMLIVVN